jgi:hypothetical protein
MSDDRAKDTDPKIDREIGDNDPETEGHVKPNMDPTGEIDESDVPREDREY